MYFFVIMELLLLLLRLDDHTIPLVSYVHWTTPLIFPTSTTNFSAIKMLPTRLHIVPPLLCYCLVLSIQNLYSIHFWSSKSSCSMIVWNGVWTMDMCVWAWFGIWIYLLLIFSCCFTVFRHAPFLFWCNDGVVVLAVVHGSHSHRKTFSSSLSPSYPPSLCLTERYQKSGGAGFSLLRTCCVHVFWLQRRVDWYLYIWLIFRILSIPHCLLLSKNIVIIIIMAVFCLFLSCRMFLHCTLHITLARLWKFYSYTNTFPSDLNNPAYFSTLACIMLRSMLG